MGGISKIERGDGTVRLTVADAKDRLPRILQAIGEVESVEVRPATLDNVFIHRTGRAMRDVGAEGLFSSIFFGVYFPIGRLPSWLGPLVRADPLTFSVDALRHVMLGSPHLALWLDLTVLTGFTAAVIAAGGMAFQRMKV
ncbi:MAG: hypothetical protein JJD97_00210 [Gemmatimonadaceae bacterium]|nr:hypothetical protein [Gemmatimonadaceae bacterium]